MRKTIIPLLLLLPVFAFAKGGDAKTLARMLGDILTVESVHPDSVLPYTRRVEEAARSCRSEESGLVYALCLGRLYNERQRQAHHAGAMDYQERGYQCFAYVFRHMELLADMKAREWTPVTTKGNGDGYFAGDMLSVAWRAMLLNTERSVRDTSSVLPSYGDMIGFYRSRGNSDAVFLLRKDSILANGASRDALLSLCQESGDASGELVTDELLHLSDPHIEVNGPSEAYPGKEYTWRITARNIASVTCQGSEHSLPIAPPYCEVADSLLWQAPSTPGMHTVTFLPSTSAKTTEKLQPMEMNVFVSRLRLIYRSVPGNRFQLIVVDGESGEPQEGVTVEQYDENNDSVPKATHITDREGRATVRASGRNAAVRVRVRTDAETQHAIKKLYHSAEWQAVRMDTVSKVTLFADRSVYCPGQQIHVGGVLYRQMGWQATTGAAGRVVRLTLRDTSGKEVGHHDATCDDMGVFSATFTLPCDGRTGTWRVRADYGGSLSLRVEEYKRPTFEVRLADSVGISADSVTVSGTAVRYDGTPLSFARVTGSVSASSLLGRGYNNAVSPDTTYTDARGHFSFRLLRDDLAANMTVRVDALSGYGEQQSASRCYRTAAGAAAKEEASVDSAFIFTCHSDTFCLDRPALLSMFSNLSDIHLYYTLSANGEVVTDTLIRFTGDTLRLAIPYRPEYGTGAVAAFCFVKGEKVYSRKQSLFLRQPDAGLSARWHTFRDRVRPGASEEWRLTLLRPDGTPADASLMATLYDASLDTFRPNKWTLKVSRPYRLFGVPYSRTNNNRGMVSLHSSYTQKRPFPGGLTFAALNDRFFSRSSAARVMPLGNISTRNAVMTAIDPIAPAAHVVRAMPDDDADGESVSEPEEAEEETPQPVPLRRDFSEDAFFFPSLRTDRNGEVSMTFTLPECLTTWRLLGVAHTRDMLTADIDELIVASKDLTAQLHLPRFARPGDDVRLTATVANSTDSLRCGKATLLLLDAESGGLLREFRADVALAANADTTYHFPYTAGEEDVIVRWTVEGEGGGDGEQRLLASLPACTDVSNTVAITVFDPCAKTIDLSSLFPAGASRRKLTVEYTTHPEQCALQALPKLARAESGDVLSVASAYYAGKLARSLGMDVSDSLAASHLTLLKAMQAPDGGFPWYPGMPSSPYLTREVGYLLGRLVKMTGDCGDADIYRRAARYLLSRMPTPKRVSADCMRDLYVLQDAGLSFTEAEKGKVDSLIALVKSLKADQTGDVEQLALASIILKRLGYDKRAGALADAFVSRLVTADSLGVYMEHPQGPFLSIDRKLHIHTQLMEALQTARPDAPELAGMRRYLLRQKRTTAWETPVTTANAVFALINGTEPAAPQAAADVITLLCDTPCTPGALNLVAPADTIGYMCHTVDVERCSVGGLRLHKFSEGESWCGVHADFRQPFAEVASSSTGLSVAVRYPDSMMVGQRVTAVYTIVADRDYDYVTLTLPHPAAMEAVSQLSGYCRGDGLGYYREPKDDRTLLHMHHLPRGHYVLEEDFFVERGGAYHTGVSSVCCEYAPEYGGHSADKELFIEE